MKRRLVRSVVVLGLAGGLFATSALPQTSVPIKVSDAIEGGRPGVSVARCGTTIVAGFGDQEASPSNSFDGYAVSNNGGASFRDLGVLPGAVGNFQLIGSGSPAMACSSSSVFYAASRYGHSDAGGQPFTDIAISTSLNGGNKWSLPVIASSGTADIYRFIMPTMAVDPTNAQQLYIAYVNQNSGGADTPDCPFGGDILEFVHSSDGGKTWDGRSDPAIAGRPDMQLDHACGAGQPAAISEPSVVVSPSGAVYIAYEYQGSPSGAALHEIRFVRSLDHGKTFSAPLVVSSGAIYNTALQLGVDRTHSPRSGEIYLTWSGQPTGTYTDVLFSDSLNGGASFSFPRPISPNPAAGAGRFQSNPVVAVDNDGQVQVCFYDTGSNAPTSSSVYSYNCATSSNYAATWQIQRLVSSAPVGSDAVTSDFLTHHDGFFTAFELQTNGTRRVVGQFADIN